MNFSTNKCHKQHNLLINHDFYMYIRTYSARHGSMPGEERLAMLP